MNKLSQLSNFRAQQAANSQMQQAQTLAAAASKITAAAALQAANSKPQTLIFASADGSYHNETANGITAHTFKLDARTIAEALENWKQVNPRGIDALDNHVKLGILDTLRNAPEQMRFRNGGLTLTAKSVTRDPDTGEIYVQLTDRELHGLLNGGHTTHWTLQVKEEMRKAGTLSSWDCHVPTTIVVGLKSKEDVAELSDSLNTNKSVQRSMSANMRGKYDILIESLAAQHYADNIGYKGEKGKIKLQELFRILTAFDKFNYPNGKVNPIRVDLETSKKGKGSFTAILDEQHAADFLPELNADGTVKKHNNSMKMLFANADTFLVLRDQIARAIFEDAKNAKIVTNVVSGGSTPKRMVDSRAKKLQYLQSNGNDILLKGNQWAGWINPLMNAFRSNLEWDSVNETVSWTVPNSKLMKAAMPDMLKHLVKRHKELSSNPANLLRDVDTFAALYEICETHVTRLAP